MSDSDYQEACKYFSYDPETGVLKRNPLPRSEFKSDRAWRASKAFAGKPAGTKNGDGYMQIRWKGTLYRAHRIIWLLMTGDWPEHDVDHRNGIRHDNRWLNLRAATRSENNQNRAYTNPIGACWRADINRWHSRIRVNGKRIHLGYFRDREEAIEAYRQAKAKYHEFQPTVRLQATD